MFLPWSGSERCSQRELYTNWLLFFPYCVNTWNNLNQDIKCQTSISVFKNELMRFLRPKCFSVYNVHDPIGLKLLTRMRVNLSQLREHTFKHGFQDTLNPLCSVINLETESVEQFFLHCPFFAGILPTLLDNLSSLINDPACQTYLMFI